MENKKLETALHSACMARDDDTKLKELLKADCNVNARNFWGQTPLHYAAKSNSITKIQLLLQVPSIDVKLTDINGYNALHILIKCGQAFDNDFKEGIDALINAGVCINTKTNSGQTVLHLAAMQTTNTDCDNKILMHILCKYQDADKLLTNKMGENFLHLFMNAQNDNAIILELLRELSKPDKNLPPKLLNDKNIRGQTPFYCFVKQDHSLSWKIIEPIIQTFGACVKTTDNLGNTMLHHLLKDGRLTSDVRANAPDVLVKNGADINKQNIWGMTAAYEIGGLKDDDVYNKMIEVYRSINFRVTDRWGRTPMFGILNTYPYGRLLDRLLTKLDLDINYQDQDNYGTTLLHLLGYIKDDIKDTETMKQVLLDKTLKSLDIKDKESNKPFQTALCHGNYKTFNMIAAKMPKAVIEGCSASVLFTHDCSKPVLLSKLINSKPFAFEGFPSNIEKFTKELLRMNHLDFHSESNNEESDIYKSMETLIDKICNKVKNYDSNLQMSIFRTGSTEDGTKVGRPDEFDFALCLDLVEKNCNIETVSDKNNIVYAMLKFKDSANDFLPFYDEDRYLQVLPLLIYLYRYIQRALHEPDIWADGNIVFNDNLRVLPNKPVFNFSVSWVKSKYKHLNISVDLVPVVYKSGWWPSGFDLSSKNIVNEEVRKAGCFVLLHNKTNTNYFMHRWIHGMQDCVFDTINVSVGVEEPQTKIKRRWLTLSVAPAEIALIKSFPEQFRKAYALAKIIKDKMVCPIIVIDVYPDKNKNTEEANRMTQPHVEIKSYWLKNCTFYVAESLRSKHGDLKHTDISTVEMTVMVYEKLLELVSESRFSPYLYESTDVLMLEKKIDWKTTDLKHELLSRKISIDGVLKFLGKSISIDNKEWLESCMKHYKHSEESENWENTLCKRE